MLDRVFAPSDDFSIPNACLCSKIRFGPNDSHALFPTFHSSLVLVLSSFIQGFVEFRGD